MKSPTIDSDGNFKYPDGSDCDPYIWRKGEKHEYDAPDEARMVAELLLNEVLFVNSRKYVWEDWNGGEVNIENETLVLFVSCNDIFHWACSDAESVSMKELPSLYEAWKSNPRFGTDRWCAIKRNMRPQLPVEKMMKEAGVWDSELEKLTR